MQDLLEKTKKEAKRDADDRAVVQRDEAAAAKEDNEYQVNLTDDRPGDVEMLKVAPWRHARADATVAAELIVSRRTGYFLGP